jgi:hypothetical protein
MKLILIHYKDEITAKRGLAICWRSLLRKDIAWKKRDIKIESTFYFCIFVC